MGNESEESNKKNVKKKKIIKKIEKKQKNNSNFQNNNHPNIHKLIYCKEDYNENEQEIEEFKRKLQLDSIHAKHTIKIKPQFSQRWLEDML